MSIKPGQIPDWRPGAVYWKPLADGREVTIYSLKGGKARLCVGPLAHPKGYDSAFRYESVNAARVAAESWDPERSENPPDFEAIDFGKGTHKKKLKKLLIHPDGVQVGAKMELTEQVKEHFEVTEIREQGSNDQVFLLEGKAEDGSHLFIEAFRKHGDTVGNSGAPLVVVSKVQIEGDDDE